MDFWGRICDRSQEGNFIGMIPLNEWKTPIAPENGVSQKETS